MTEKTARPGEFPVRKCTDADLDAIMALQETVYNALENKELFVTSSREENAVNLVEPNFILGCFNGEQLIAYCSLAVPGENNDNLGWDLGWQPEKVRSCARLDTVAVHPDYRGGIQQRLMHRALAFAAENRCIQCILTTVSPQNKYSLHNVQAMGFEILMKKLKYGGKERFILGRPPVLPNNIETGER